MRIFNRKIPSTLIALAIISSCGRAPIAKEVYEGDDPNFKIEANNDGILDKYDRKVVVFGVDIYAVPGVQDEKLFHAANVMAQYLDNNEDGNVDDPLVIEKMLENRAFLVMWKTEKDLRGAFPEDRMGQDLGNDETHPNYVARGRNEEFDATLEEVLHIINSAGHSYAYPEVFGQHPGSSLAKAMDIARGGQFLSIPKTYPEDAWYSYDDKTCDYADCQTIEYLYWAITSILGAQENRFEEIGHEWKLNTRKKVEETDTAIYSILIDPRFKMPRELPDGTYRH